MATTKVNPKDLVERIILIQEESGVEEYYVRKISPSGNYLFVIPLIMDGGGGHWVALSSFVEVLR